MEETVAGNIIKGFDNYIKGSTAAGGASATGGGGGTSTRRKGQVMDADRIFSRSSVSFMRVCTLLFLRSLCSKPGFADLVSCSFSQELSPTSSAQTTPSHAATPTSGLPNPPLSARESNHATPTSSTSMRATSSFKKGTKRSDKEDEENEGKTPKRLKITYARAGVNE